MLRCLQAQRVSFQPFSLFKREQKYTPGLPFDSCQDNVEISGLGGSQKVSLLKVSGGCFQHQHAAAQSTECTRAGGDRGADHCPRNSHKNLSQCGRVDTVITPQWSLISCTSTHICFHPEEEMGTFFSWLFGWYTIRSGAVPSIQTYFMRFLLL